MCAEGVDLKRRRFLTVTASVVGGAGAIAATVPFISSMQPSARAQAAGAPVEADISGLAPGQMMIVEWRGKPVWVVRRTEEALATLPTVKDQLRDPDSQESEQPDYAKNAYRSIRPEILVLIGICTHLGCSPTFRPDQAPADLGADWPGGFFCPCHGSRFDYAGRVYEGVPAPTNLTVPPYRFVGDGKLVIGEAEEVA